MSGLTSRRERKAVAAFAAAAAEAEAADHADQADADVDTSGAARDDSDSTIAATHAAASASAAAAADPSPPRSVSPCCWTLLHALSTLLVFSTVFVAFSFATTGTPLYGLSPAQGAAALRRQLDAAKIRVQEAAGLRPRPMFANYDAQPMAYGAVNKKDKQKQKPVTLQTATDTGTGASAVSPTASVPGVAPPQSSAPSAGDSESSTSTIDAASDDDAVVIEPRPAVRDPAALYLTLDELSKFDGSDGGRIFLAVYGRIFDVTAGRDFYGPGASYANLAAKDASRAFATNCYNNQGLHDLRGLSKEQFKGIDHWYKFYNEHEKYRAIGWLDLPDIADDAPMPNDEC